jgi:hypothetical protein
MSYSKNTLLKMADKKQVCVCGHSIDAHIEVDLNGTALLGECAFVFCPCKKYREDKKKK